MAIIIEEEKRKINLFAVAAVLLMIAVIGAVIYYLFFVSPPLIEKIVPVDLQSLQKLSAIKLEPDAIINNPSFQILKQYTNQIEIKEESVGKNNPFLK